MIEQYLNITSARLWLSAYETLYMVSVALIIGTILAMPIAISLWLTRPEGICTNKVCYMGLNTIINVVRSIPFIILIVFVMPFTKWIIGTRVGTTAAIVPLVIYIAPYLARLIENSLLSVSEGIVETAQSMGASIWQIMIRFLLPEAKHSILLALTTGTIGLIGATAMAGYIGGGGVGNLALTYGYQRFNTALMIFTVIVLIIFVQLIQEIGNRLAKRLRTHK